ncbi:adaptor protein MecA [Paracerasibacillus soli]|uniref:Adapter protein MecA n=1 Tax=Paracerasibacillus soli TaxID=480284 RepID=A0ABU5CPU9_9BACI|nr:adaptor protein MecA [Virgibacillus soli]MDY0407906.1 adaptor protein MecA [Virgibacillus soli]
MEIERINENTIKFYISYVDIEDRGFQKEEIWYNRERSEQLFWQMMEELNYKEDFNVEGPLWIQVQALEKGLEIIVTKAQLSKDGEKLEIPNDSELEDLSIQEKVENFLESKFGESEPDAIEKLEDEEDFFWIIASFKDFEDVIQLSHYLEDVQDDMNTVLYAYEGSYYLYIEFMNELIEENRQENLISRIFEYGNDSDMTIHILEEYGRKYSRLTYSNKHEITFQHKPNAMLCSVWFYF